MPIIRKSPYPRTRETNLGVRIHGPARIDMLNGQTGVTSTSYTGLASLSQYERCSDVVTPGYAQRIAAGDIVNNPFSKVKVLYPSTGDSGFSARYTLNGYTHVWSMDRDVAIFSFGVQGYSGLKYVSQDNLVKLAQTEALAGVQPAEMQGLVAVAEAKKTFTMLVSPARGLRNLIQNSVRDYQRDLDRFGEALNRFASIKNHKARQKAIASWKRTSDARKAARLEQKRKSQRFVDRLRFIPEMVLSYNLGWKPLMMDIDAVLRKIPRLESQERATSRATKSDERTWSETKTQTSGSGLVCTFRYDYTESCVVRAGVLFADTFASSKHFGTRLADVPAALWEVVPFSFLLDYAVNVEKFIQASSISHGMSMLAYFTKVTIETTSKRTWVSCTGPAPWVVTKPPSGSDAASYKATIRFPDVFTASLAHTPLFDWTYRPPAQLQNVLSLLTNQLYGTKNRMYR